MSARQIRIPTAAQCDPGIRRGHPGAGVPGRRPMTPRDWCILFGLLAGAGVAAWMWVAGAPRWPENQTTGATCGQVAPRQVPGAGVPPTEEPRA